VAGILGTVISGLFLIIFFTIEKILEKRTVKAEKILKKYSFLYIKFSILMD
jgi:hypothetical protein